MKTPEINPLSPAAFHVLLALASQDLHGYGIILEVVHLSDGQYRLGPGTLYDNLKKLMNLGWVEDYEERSMEKRRLYRLSSEGRDVLAADVRRMKRVVRIANRRLGPEGGRA